MTEKKDVAPTPASPETLKTVHALTVKARKVMEGLQGGIHVSPHLGASVEFAEHKKYAPGDDIRHLDWRVLARTDRHFVKQHQREVMLRCLLMLDSSPSMGYQGTRATRTKLAFAKEILAALAHILVRQGDSVGLLSFDAKSHHFISPRHGPDHLPFLMSHLAGVEAADDGGTDFSGAVSGIADHAGRRAMIVLVSDLWGVTKETELALAGLAARGNDVVVFHLLSPDEVDLPFDSEAVFEGMEGESDVSANPSLIRQDYKEAVTEVLRNWKRMSEEAGIDLISATTVRDPAEVLFEFIARRHGPSRFK